MKLLPKVYKSITTEPFRVEEYKDKKIEFHYLDDTEYLAKYVSKGKFAVWTSNGQDYKLLIEKGYYDVVSDLYGNDINEIWLDFMNFAYATQAKVTKKYNLWIFVAFLVALGASIGLSQVMGDNSMAPFAIGMVVLFVPLYVLGRRQQKEISTAIREENVRSTEKIKEALGEKRFEDLLTQQQAYYDKFFAFEDDEVKEEIETVETDSEVVEAEVVEEDESIGEDSNER